MDPDLARDRLLDAAEELFYARGIQTVGMDDIRAASGVSLKRLYRLFPAKEQLVEAYLERRDTTWRARLAEHVEQHEDPERRILAVFDWLELWFAEPGFRGCAWINSYGELGAVSDAVTRQARHHKEAFRTYLEELVTAAGLPGELAGQLLLLAEGAMVTAGIFGRTDPAAHARTAAAALVGGYRRN
ncbi:DNA-binding transcriptional regulator, AcrR family [Amycolatopsis sacchari]|uniref:DNA-binding transcriptional regulator, AcrR family n=1 Tax=Amycolatopsis sacchari TaxID=115433 RepID=A0A1I3LZB5_9PSEU|nr:TetR/AcrR family transcriptional regulator [Amycolatopsis sacchari]SFI90131.1 DNA-binding transcriptional regulator, AcrR family [Amycolatopsis sacchari]